jgi:hypothetical protein
MIETIDSCGSFAEALLRNAQENINDSIKGLRVSSVLTDFEGWSSYSSHPFFTVH